MLKVVFEGQEYKTLDVAHRWYKIGINDVTGVPQLDLYNVYP